MAWPGLSEYNAALLNAAEHLVPGYLKGYRLVLGPSHMPMPVSGGYAYIYELRDAGGTRKALRCFREDEPARRTRAAAVCAGLGQKTDHSPDLSAHFIPATWVDPCVRTSAGEVPAMVMDWANGVTLGAKLEAIQDDPTSLRELRARIANMLGLLVRHGVVHGDLQTGNILVKPDGTPVLIDYDGMLLPGVQTGPASPDLHPNFQHPAWDDSCDPWLKDRFPAMVMDLGLAAAAEDPGLFQRFSTGENIIFRSEDLADPELSPVFAALRSMPTLSRAAELLAGLALGPVAGLPSFGEFTEEAWKARPAAATPVHPEVQESVSKTRTAAKPYRGVYPVYDATDYNGISDAIGDKVEVIGQVVSIKRSVTKYGNPYVFVNFGNWKQDGFKLTVWSEGLATFRKQPGPAWERRWISATGLVDEPYTNKRYKNTQLSITIQDASQVRFIDEAEAMRRLGRREPGASLDAATWKSGTRETYSGSASHVRTQARPLLPTAGAKPSNAELLERLSKTPGARPSAQMAPVWKPKAPPGTQAGLPAPVSASNGPDGCSKGFGLVIGVIIGIILLAYLYGSM
ncbi:MAG: phosphotransferase [Spirochaetia bacterium]|nr:phosphotransferase [Spirochaetia bacterium]